MYKNQLQELAQRSCFNLPSYSCIREGPDHAPRFKASVNFNGDVFSSPTFCTTLRQAEHSAAQVALNALSSWGPSKSLAARILDETGVYKNLLQGTAYRAGLKLPVYTTVKSGPAHVPVFTTTVELAGMSFTGDSAKTKKQAEKNAAISAWISLKTMPNTDLSSGSDQKNEEADCGGGDQVAVTKALSNFRKKDGGKQQIMRKDQNRRKVKKNASLSNINSPKYQFQTQREPIDLLMGSVAAAAPQSPTRQTESSFASFLPPPPPPTASKILPLTSSQVPQIEVHKGDNEFDVKKGANPSNPIYGPIPPLPNPVKLRKTHPILLQHDQTHEFHGSNFTPPPIGAALPGWHRSRGMMSSGGGFQPHRIAPAVQIRTIIPVCSAPPPARPLNPPVIKEASPSQAQTGTQVSSPSSSSSLKLDKLHL